MNKSHAKRWPLHPKPYLYETLNNYIRRLADSYGVGYRYFLQKALAMSSDEIQTYRHEEFPPKALQRLSDGTGISKRRLKLMTFSYLMKRIVKEINETMTPQEINEWKEKSKFSGEN